MGENMKKRAKLLYIGKEGYLVEHSIKALPEHYTSVIGINDRPLFVGDVGKNVSININSSPTSAGVYLQYRYK